MEPLRRTVIKLQAEDLSQGQRTFSEPRIWVDGCFDLAHYGHFRAFLLAKQLCRCLVVGVHSDEEILRVKGPTVLTFEERVSAVAASKWPSLVVAGAPYETSATLLDYFGADVSLHGDDAVIDKNGNYSLHHIQQAGRLSEFPRYVGKQSISTTALIERVLKSTNEHHVKGSLSSYIHELRRADPLHADFLYDRLTALSMNESGDGPMTTLWDYAQNSDRGNATLTIIKGCLPKPDQRVVYVDGDFDLFCPSHIEFLRIATEANFDIERGTNPYVIVGLYDDSTVNKVKGSNFPIANIFERAMCLL